MTGQPPPPVVYRGKEVANEPMVLSLELVGEGLYSTAWVHFSDDARASEASTARCLQIVSVFGRLRPHADLCARWKRAGNQPPADLRRGCNPADGYAVTRRVVSCCEQRLVAAGGVDRDLWWRPDRFVVVAEWRAGNSCWSWRRRCHGQTRCRRAYSGGVHPRRKQSVSTEGRAWSDYQYRWRSVAPQAFALEQNYPNPPPPRSIRSRPSGTRFRLTVGAGAGVRLSVYDLLGPRWRAGRRGSRGRLAPGIV